ncbi:MAG: hypothetical protein JW918_03930 [Anaerolineae bacterium]|nr:hypothetical protein [Anaerolineae bacterium]
MTVLNESTLLYPTSLRDPADAARLAAQAAVEDVQSELDRLIESLAKGGPRPVGGPEATPTHVIISSKDNLTDKYGQPGFEQLDQDLRQLKQAIEAHAALQAIVVYVDDGACLAPFQLKPVDPKNPWQVKMLVDNLDTHLGGRGRAIRYVLIVGGNDIIPFHRLPNPIDDQDSDVPSDNPYASRDANYLIPERALGRLPDGEGSDVAFLHALLQTTIAGHQKPIAPKGLLSDLVGMLRPAERSQRNGNGLGYSASIWRRASRAVFQVIGDNRRLRTSPPFAYDEFGITERLRFSYFNLHGVEDGANWYGQPDALFPADYPLFPVALRPKDLSADEHADSVVFTEACYGANILGKNAENSIALRFLASKALALIGSTKISYGSLAPPLVGADLISKHFWEGLQAGLSVGEALKVAKVNLAQEMQERQGYLDGDDQKTLVSFVLYGDPSLRVTALQTEAAKGIPDRAICPPLICQKKGKFQKALASEELVAAVKKRVEADLPYMAQAEVRAARLTQCNGNCDHRCALSAKTTKAGAKHAGKWALILEKDIPSGNNGAHHQIIKVTVDEGGHILKMAMSK